MTKDSKFLGVTRQTAGSITAQEEGGARGNFYEWVWPGGAQGFSESNKGWEKFLLYIGSLLCGNRNVLKPQVCFEVPICRPALFSPLVRPSRLQNLLPLWGARDVMSGRGLVDCRIYCRLRAPEEML